MNPVQALGNRLPHGSGQTQEGGAAAHAAGEKILHADRVAGVEAGALGHVADPGLLAALAGLGKGDDALVLPLAQHRFQEGGLARSVGADEGHQLPAVDVEIHVPEYFFTADGDAEILHPQAAGVAAGAAVYIKIHPKASFITSMFRYMASK